MNSYDEIKNLLKKSRMIAQTRYPSLSEGVSEIKNKYLITEEDDIIDDDSQIQNYDVAKSVWTKLHWLRAVGPRFVPMV